MKNILSVVAGVFLVGALVSVPAEAQLLEVKQTVFGMDCAPCAYALEKRMKGIDGIEKATVSLNKGLATVALTDENELTLKQLRDAVRDSGFSPREATIRAAGSISKKGDAWIFTLASGEHFRLSSGNGQKRFGKGRAVVTGHIPETPSSDPPTLEVISLEAA